VLFFGAGLDSAAGAGDAAAFVDEPLLSLLSLLFALSFFESGFDALEAESPPPESLAELFGADPFSRCAFLP